MRDGLLGGLKIHFCVLLRIVTGWVWVRKNDPLPTPVPGCHIRGLFKQITVTFFQRPGVRIAVRFFVLKEIVFVFCKAWGTYCFSKEFQFAL